MLTAITLATLACAAAPVPAAAPPLRITYSFARTISTTLVRKILAEADTIWKPAGITFAWEALRSDAAVETLQIIVEDSVAPATVSATTRLGWILFDEHSVPDRVLHISYTNAVTLLEGSRMVVGHVDAMPTSERETYLGRAMGRALAHELGHYLLASKVHTSKGLMQARLSAWELFSPARGTFELPPAVRDTLVARLYRSGANVTSP